MSDPQLPAPLPPPEALPQQVPLPPPVPPLPQVRWVETPPLEYHQLMRGAPRYRWWKPLVALVLAFIYYLVLSAVFGIIVLVPYFLLAGGSLDADDLLALALPDTQQPVSIVLTLGSIALMIPAALMAMMSVGLNPWKRLWSVALRIRWRWIWRTVLPAFVALIVMNVVGIALEIAFAGGLESEAALGEGPELDVQAALLSLLFVLLLVPLQATAEELVYRGMFMQTLGAWLGGVRGTSRMAAFWRGPWLPIAVPAVLFGFSHIYDVWGFLAVTAMAVAAGWLSWRTGGLEAAISLHVINNLVAFGFLAAAVGGETGQTSDGGGAGSLIGSIVGLALFCWWVDRDFRRRDGRRTRIDMIEERPRPAVYTDA
jgi:membrane protease YdiL (CAAX protease family)